MMSKAFIHIFLFALSITLVFGQEGNYPVSHFNAASQFAELYPHKMVQDRHGMIYIAYNRGIIRFDGNEWEQINTPTSIFSLAYYGNKIYTGGPTGFGLLERGNENTWEYTPLHGTDPQARITEMRVHNGRLIGLSENAISILDLKTRTYKKIEKSGDDQLISMFRFKQELYIVNDALLPFKIKDDSTLVKDGSTVPLPEMEFLSKAPGSEIYLGGSGKGDLFLYRNKFSKIQWNPEDAGDLEYITESEITNAVWVSDTLVAVSSLKGGIIFIQPFKGKINKIVNASSGLPDNEVFGIMADNNSSVWVAHEKGLSRISPYLPYRTFDQFPGLEGNILSIKRHGGHMYVGTTEGLFWLKRVEHVKKIPVLSSNSSINQKEKGFWKKIWPFKKKQTADSRQFIRELQSVDYVFEKLQGLDSKVFNLSMYNQKLVAAGLDGLFIIYGDEVKQLASVPVRYAHYSPWRDVIYMTSYDGEVFVMPPSSGAVPERINREHGEPVSYLFEDSHGNMYFCGIHTMFQVPREQVRNTRKISTLQNPFYEETYGYMKSDSVFFLHKNTGKSNQNAVASVNGQSIKLPELGISDVIPGEGGAVWVLREGKWRQLGVRDKTVIPDLSIFRKATYFADDKDKNGKWIITGEKNLFFFENEPTSPWTPNYSVFLYEVNAGGTLLDPADELVMEQEAGNFSFRFSQAEYTHLVDIEFQYYIEGLNDEWSEWSSAHKEINFSYLPAGNYTLNFRSKNSLGQIDTLPPVFFKVLSPYWKRPWFYLMEFAFIGLMLLISVRMKAMGYKYRLMSRLLALLTLIIIIELIQILAESKFETETSPVVDFVIQVIIAIIILPVEEILRKYIFKEKNVKVSDLFTIRETQRRRRRRMALDAIPESETADQ